MRVSFLALAKLELDETFAWYEEQKVSLGYDFLDEFDQTVRLISVFPDAFEVVDEGVRRCLINRFPYAVIYGIHGEQITIIAVAHLRKFPHYWHERVKH